MNDSVETPAILSEILPSIDLKREALGKKRGHKNKCPSTYVSWEEPSQHFGENQ